MEIIVRAVIAHFEDLIGALGGRPQEVWSHCAGVLTASFLRPDHEGYSIQLRILYDGRIFLFIDGDLVLRHEISHPQALEMVERLLADSVVERLPK